MAQFLVSLATALIMLFGVMLPGTAYLIFLERKVAAWTQDRIGPNRTNFSFGLLPMKARWGGLDQALSDGLKLFIKEDYTPPHVDRVLFLLAPIVAVVPAMIGWAVVPWGGSLAWDGQRLEVAAAPINIGVIYILTIGSLAVYGVVLAGYASNNKYSFLGGLRATAQMLSYEIPQALCVLIVILTSYGAIRADEIVALQAGSMGQAGESLAHRVLFPGGGVWNVFYHPLLAVIFFTCVLAECNRAPFDLAEAEQELVGGYHTEYSSMKWALFFLGEYMHMITGCAFFALLFLGGWDAIPFFGEFPRVAGLGEGFWGTHAGALVVVLLKVGVYSGKVLFLLFVMMWIRWTLPRFRFDQLMRLAWRSLIPGTLVLLLASGLIVFLRVSPWWYLLANLAALAGMVVLGPLVPAGPPMNRKVPLEGSRYSAPAPRPL